MNLVRIIIDDSSANHRRSTTSRSDALQGMASPQAAREELQTKDSAQKTQNLHQKDHAMNRVQNSNNTVEGSSSRPTASN